MAGCVFVSNLHLDEGEISLVPVIAVSLNVFLVYLIVLAN